MDVVGGYVALRPSGSNHMGLCPFHNERTPSFSVNAERQIFHCFGCGAGGNVLSFVMRIENLDFTDALKMLASRVHFSLPEAQKSGFAKKQSQRRELTAEMNKIAARFFYDSLQAETPQALAARGYLDKRGVPPALRRRFGLGLSPDGWDALLNHMAGLGHKAADVHTAGLVSAGKAEGKYYDRFRGRLMFPIIDAQNRIAGFGGRILGTGEPKYLNSPETVLFDKSRTLYGWPLAKKTRAKEIVLSEGYMDVISLHSAGFANSVGVLGTALSPEHARLLKRSGVEAAILLMDSDSAGTAAALRAIPILQDAGLKVRVLQVTDAKDPDEYIQRFGAERFGELLRGAESHVTFRVGLLRKKYNLRVTDQRVAFTQEAAQILSALRSEIETDAYLSEVARATGISPDAIRGEIVKHRSGAPPPPLRRRFSPERKVSAAEKGLNEARKGLVNLVFSSSSACAALMNSGCIEPEQLGDETAARLIAIAYERAAEGKRVLPADAVARFETIEEQQRAAEILNAGTSFLTREDTEKALNEMTKVIKRAWLDSKIEELGNKDINAAKSLFESKRILNSLYITITDG